jgi:hypothetical protein
LVDGLRREAEAVAHLPDRLRSRGEAYFDRWAADADLIQDPDLRAASAARREQVMAAYDRVVGSMWSAQVLFRPQLVVLRDVRLALGNDLTRGGLEAVRGMSGRVAEETATVNGRIGELIVEVDGVAAALSSSLGGS